MGDKIEGRIDALERRLKQLKAQKRRADTRKQARLTKRERREELRKKILVGAIVLAKVERGEIERALLRAWLEEALTKEEDRALFGFGDSATADSS